MISALIPAEQSHQTTPIMFAYDVHRKVPGSHIIPASFAWIIAHAWILLSPLCVKHSSQNTSVMSQVRLEDSDVPTPHKGFYAKQSGISESEVW